MPYAKDEIDNTTFTYKELFAGINGKQHHSPFYKYDNFYNYLLNFSFSLINNLNLTLLDKEFTESETALLTGNDLTLNDNKEVAGLFNATEENFSTALLNSQSKITLYTSGTTGLPKAVTHPIQNLLRSVKTGERYRTNIWGFCYNPTHIAGIQVLLQALANGCSIINLYGLSRDRIVNAIREYGITNISATPTFIRMLKPFNEKLESVVNVTFGGEKLDSKLKDEIPELFPNARITNIYALTEAGTLLASKGDLFFIKDDLTELVKIDENEIIVHKSLLGEEVKENEWYRTGDLIEFTDDDNKFFRFVCRKNDMVNIGGYKINPLEIEEQLQQYPGISGVSVFSKSNSVMGKVLVANIALQSGVQISENELKNYLREFFQENKIPRKFYFVDSITQTRTGKLKRE